MPKGRSGRPWSAGSGRASARAGCRRRGTTTPVRWHGRTLYADALWDTHALVAELHGLRFHRAPSDRQRDDERLNVYTLAGLRCLVFTWRDVFEDMPRVVATIAHALAAAT